MIDVAEQKFIFRFGEVEYDLSSRTHLMGILNVTPDSFSDGGKYFTRQAAIEHALQMVDDGADIIDVGGESTRPRSQAYGDGAEFISAEEELERVIPVIEDLVNHCEVPISVDTYKSTVAREALKAGASIVNDISGFTFSAEMPSVVAEAGASAVVMHIQGTPKTMQQNPTYQNVVLEVVRVLDSAIEKGRQAGVRQLFVDPGIGFGKNVEHNLILIGHLNKLSVLGCPIVVGPSRKSFIGTILNTSVNERLEGSLASATSCILNGAHVLRVHDVKETKRATLLADAIKHAMRDSA